MGTLHPGVSLNLGTLLKDWLMLIKTHRKYFRRKGNQLGVNVHMALLN